MLKMSKRKLAAAIVVALLADDEEEEIKKKRSVWVQPLLKEREFSNFYNDLYEMLQKNDPKVFRNFVKMDASDFDCLAKIVTPRIKRQNTSFRKAITPEERLAVTLRFLATGESFGTLRNLFRISKASICNIVEETCDALYEGLKDTHLKFPSTLQDWKNIAAEFEERWHFPHCCGALDGRHIAVKAPKNIGSEYLNYKKFNSIILMALADANYRFSFVDIKGLGCDSEGVVFTGSATAEKLLELPPPELLSNAEVMPFCAVTYNAFPLKENIMKPYEINKLTTSQKVFNYRLSRARRIIENVFGLCSSRFRILLKTNELAPEKVEKLVLATCALHNFFIDRKSVYCSSIDFDHEKVDGSILWGGWRQDINAGLTRLNNTTPGLASPASAEFVRDKWMNYFVGPGKVDWQYTAVAGGLY